MAPELQAAAERIFREGLKAGIMIGTNQTATSQLALMEAAVQNWRRNQPGYRPGDDPAPRKVGKAPELAAPYSGGIDVVSDPYLSTAASVFLAEIATAAVFSDPTPSAPDWNGDSFTGGGGGDAGGGGASGEW